MLLRAVVRDHSIVSGGPTTVISFTANAPAISSSLGSVACSVVPYMNASNVPAGLAIVSNQIKQHRRKSNHESNESHESSNKRQTQTPFV